MKWVVTILLLLAVRVGVWAAPAEPVPFWHEKEKYVALRDIAALHRMEMSDPVAQRVTLKNATHTLIFKTEGRELLLVIDPGHGGQDTGAKGRRGVEEKRVALDIARRLRAHLVKAGHKVYMTRESDRFIELDERCRKAGRWGADLFVSVHFNSAGNPAAAGVETYVMASAGYESTSGGLSNLTQPGNRFEAVNGIAGYQIQRALVSRLGAIDRGVKRSRFLVLKNAPCPAVLVECGFLSNPAEEERLLQEEHREALAQSLARGTLNYLNLVKRAQLVETP